jgi:hypothetical protein
MNSARREPLGRTIILKKMERSDTITLGTLDQFRHFRHLPAWPLNEI